MSEAIAKNHPLPAQYASELLVIRSGAGVRLVDAAGKRYLDFAGGIAVNALGYGREDLARAAYEQMLRLPHVSNVFATEPALELARRLRASGDWAAVFFGNSGTEANEAALKYARMYALRTKGPDHHRILCFTGAFHGRTLGALSCTPTPKYQDPFAPLVPGVSVAPYDDEAALERALDAGFAAVIVEPVQGEGGLSVMSPGFAAALNRLCRKHDVLLIADEVQTGLCRTGDLFASRGIGLEPDLVTLAKPLAGGLPLSAVLIPDKVNRLLHLGEHGTTFGGGPVTTAVALKVWDIVSQPSFAAAVREKGEHLHALLEGMRTRHPDAVTDVRGRGLLAGFGYRGDGAALIARLAERGLLVLRTGADGIRIAPPLVITKEEIAEGVNIIEEALA
jgi:acetylornithine/N-succinyldiaminopimelate aminotransferase